MKAKKVLIVTIAALLINMLVTTAFAAQWHSFIFHDTEKGQYYRVDGKVVGNATIKPIMFTDEGTGEVTDVFIPLRELAEMTGFNVDWNDDEKTVIISKEGFYEMLPVCDKYVYINGERHSLKKKLILENGVTYFYIRDYDPIFASGDMMIGRTTTDKDITEILGEGYEGEEAAEKYEQLFGND